MSPLEFVSTFFIPTYLFLFLNLIIGTIYITSRLAKPHPQHQAAPFGRHLIDRVRSIDLSFYKFGSHPEQDPVHYHYNPGQDSAVVDGLPPARAPSLLRRLRSINFYQKKFEHRDPEPEQLHPAETVYNSAVSRQQSPALRAPLLPVDTLNRAPSFPEFDKSIKSPSFYNPGEVNLDMESDHEDVNEPADDHAHGLVRTIRSVSKRMVSETSAAAAEDIVEAEKIGVKADDFIQWFRQQLRLQRLDSLMRYKDLITGGAAGAAS